MLACGTHEAADGQTCCSSDDSRDKNSEEEFRDGMEKDFQWAS